MPIESLEVGDLVLSQPDTPGERAYKRVVSADAVEDKHVCLFEYVIFHEKTARSLVVTSDRPFWADGFGWIAAGQLAGETLELLNKGARAVMASNPSIERICLPPLERCRVA